MDIQSLTLRLGGTYHNGKGQAPCPICQPERRNDQNALSLLLQGNRILAHCFKSECSYAQIALAAKLPTREAGYEFEAQKGAVKVFTKCQLAQTRRARTLWKESRPIQGTEAEAYLQGRGISIPLPKSLRFVPDIYHGPSSSKCCAMVANVEPCGGVHRTYFTHGGVRLATFAKMMLGPCSGGAVGLSNGDGPLIVCEGIETGLSLLQIFGDRSPTVWAALSTSGIKGLELPMLAHRLIIGGDGDEAGKRAATSLAWRATALGWSVSLMLAPRGKDWNDVLVAGAAS
ncbi:toprim domain-containing protein [Falsihalocynthiibacter sp. CO-5D18]|uniref:DUF7146 domain-containing protein n=1 Tax=Falsihalocynthiibacter sp. CO-5D18 TaxID=3240872 RepID=UPI0035108AF4